MKRYSFVNTNSYPERCKKADYEFWRKDFEGNGIDKYPCVKKLEKHLRGWSEAVYNHFGALIGYTVG